MWPINMDLKIKHFTNFILFAGILGLLCFFYSQNGIYSTIEVHSERGLDPFRNSISAVKRNVHFQGGAYRQSESTKYARGLLWVENEHISPIEGKELRPENYSYSKVLNEAESDAECNDVHKLNASERCRFVNTTADCEIDEGFLDYIYFVYCAFSSDLLPLGMMILVFWLLFLFLCLAVTADEFFCPSLAVISDTLRLSHNVAGVTFLAFGNGAPDIFSAIAAIGKAKHGDAGLAIGALFGAGMFITTVVAGSIAIICPLTSMQRPFLRDIVFFLAATFWTFYILWDKKITQFEAIGFIILYVVYVLVVVISRYIYTRQRRNDTPVSTHEQPIGMHGPDPGQSLLESLTSTLKTTAIDEEEKPLLSHPDVISVTIVQDTSSIKAFLHHINPIDQDNWSGFSLFKKFYEIFKAPIMLCLNVTIPVVNHDKEKNNWNRHSYCLQCVLGPVFAVVATKVGFTKLGGSFPVWVLVLILGMVLAAVVYFTSTNDTEPKYHSMFAYLGFIIAVVWIYTIANEIVNILQTFGMVMKISNAILGLTLLAVGNSIGDFIADTTMAIKRYPRMGISACFGGPLLNLLLGIGIPFTISTVKEGDYEIQITLQEVILAAFLAFSLISSLIIVPLSRFKMSRGWGIYLVILYVVFFVVAILTETGVIHAEIDTSA